MKYDKKRIGKELRKHRLALGLTQEKAAERAEISLDFYGMLEHGKAGMSVETLLGLCEALHTTPGTLLLNEFSTTPDSHWIDEKVATLPPDKQKALVELVQLFLRTF